MSLRTDCVQEELGSGARPRGFLGGVCLHGERVKEVRVSHLQGGFPLSGYGGLPKRKGMALLWVRGWEPLPLGGTPPLLTVPHPETSKPQFPHL